MNYAYSVTKKNTVGLLTMNDKLQAVKLECKKDAKVLEYFIIMPPRREGAVSVAFVRPSVRRVHSE